MLETSFSQEIWDKKYSGEFKGRPKGYYRNLAKLASRGDRDLEARFFPFMLDGRFSPGGRILAYNGRVKSNVSLMNCTTHQVEGDDLESIAETVKVIMKTSSHGQGIGINLSNLRPKGAPVNNASKTSTGSISFMELLNHVGGTIGQEGRRAALLFALDISHPDVWRPEDPQKYDFLHVKSIPGKVESANISVFVSDAFMKAVKDDQDWEMTYTGNSGGETFHVKSLVKARDLFHELAKVAHASAEPGVLFTDTIHRMSNSDLFPGFKVVGCNACSEMMLDQDGVCNLGSLNLSKYVVNPFTEDAYFDHDAFRQDVYLAVEFLDNILEIEIADERSTSPAQARSVRELRRVGLGVMGYADMLAMLGLRYESTMGTIGTTELVFRTFRDAAYEKSILLAKEKGRCGAWDHKTLNERAELVNQGFYATLPDEIKTGIILYGLRNATLLSIAPTGSISNLLGVSGGIEPLFQREYVRRVRMNGEDEFITYVHPGVQKTRELGIPDEVWTTAYEVSPLDHVQIQATIQRYIDSAIAKTTNLPSNATVEDVEKIYMMAWEHGLKGITVYRDASRSEQVLYTMENAPVNE